MSNSNSTAQIEYREIPRYVGYRFGSDGSFWSRWDNQGRLTDHWTKRDGCIEAHGYVLVKLKDTDLGRRKTVRLHKLILEAFIGPCPDGMQTRHFPDRNPANNRVENLDWATSIVNIADKKIHGTMATGVKVGSHKLTDEQVSEIRGRFAAGATSLELACIYGVSRGTIIGVAFGDTYKDSPGRPPVDRQKIRRHGAKLTRPQVEEIKRLRADGRKYAEIALLFGTTDKYILAICHGRRWTDVLPELTVYGRSAASSVAVAAD